MLKVIIGDLVKHPEFDPIERRDEHIGQVVEIDELRGRARVRWHHDKNGNQKRTWIRIDRLK